MNTEAMLRLADFLETVEDDAFCMETWWEPAPENICGAAACIAGWAVLSDPTAFKSFQIIREKSVAAGSEYPFSSRAQKILGLDRTQADQLFADASCWDPWLRQIECSDAVDSLHDVSIKHASMVLRGLATGLLDWPKQCACMACEGEAHR